MMTGGADDHDYDNTDIIDCQVLIKYDDLDDDDDLCRWSG